jgi:hypothetical protein
LKKIIFIIFLVATVYSDGKALDFKNGYVITLNNDTIYGEILNTNYCELSKNCTFREYNKSENITYLPTQLKGYRFIPGKYYVSKEIMVDSIPKIHFLEYLINAKLNFFFRQDKGLINHYYAENDTSGIRELIYINEIVHKKDEGLFKVEKKKYIGLLTVLTSDCISLQSNIENINEPDHKKLIKFGTKYHDLICPEKACVIYEKKMPLKVKIEAFTVCNFSILANDHIFQSHGLNVLLSNTKISEKAYIGLGVLYNPVLNINSNSFITSPFRIPLSINYINPMNGFSPLFSVAFDLNTFGFFQTYNAGIKYQIKKVSFNLTAEITTASFVPYIAGIKCGLMYDL